MDFKRYITKDNIKTGLIVILALSLFFAFKSCENKDANYQSEKSYRLAAEDTLHHYINKKTGDTVTYKLSAVVDQKEFDRIVNANKALEQKLSYYKNVKNVSEVKTDTKIDAVTIDFDNNDSINNSIYNSIASTLNVQPVNLHFHLDSSYMHIVGTVNEKSITIDSLNIPNIQTIIVAEKKNGLFKRNDIDVSVENSNKHIHVTGLSNINVKEKNKWYESRWIEFGVGAVVGILIAHHI